MALIICPECGASVSSFSDKCIHCGFPIAAQELRDIVGKNKQRIDDGDTDFRDVSEDSQVNNICAIDGVEFDLSDLMNYIYEIRKAEGCVSEQERAKLIASLAEVCHHVTETTMGKVIDILIETGSIPHEYKTYGYRQLEKIREERKHAVELEALRKYRELTEVETIKCPKCGSTAVTTGQRGYSILFGFDGSSATVNRCGKCGHRWKPRK